jgi:hypothetical protein
MPAHNTSRRPAETVKQLALLVLGAASAIPPALSALYHDNFHCRLLAEVSHTLSLAPVPN